MDTMIRDMDRIAAAIDQWGVSANEDAIAAVGQRARRAGLSTVLVSVLADPTEAEIARARAFGMIAAELAYMPEREAVAAPALATVG